MKNKFMFVDTDSIFFKIAYKTKSKYLKKWLRH